MHAGLVRAFEKSLTQRYPQATVRRSIRPGTVDIVLITSKKKVGFEVRTSNFYDGLGRITLWAKEFDGAYLVVPMQLLPSPARLAQMPSIVGLIGCKVLDGTTSFEIIRQSKGHRLTQPFARVEMKPLPEVSKVVRTSIVSPKALRVARYLIDHNSTTQTQIAEDTRVSLGMVNKVISALTERELVSYRGKQLVVFDIWKLLNEISWNRPIRSLRKAEIHIADTKSIQELEKKVVQICEATGTRYALTLFSGASRYIGYGMKYGLVQAYVERDRGLFEKLEWQGTEAREGMVLEIYNIDTWDIIEEAKTIEGVVVCSPAQLVMDLVSYGSVGRDWAVKLYEATRSGPARPVNH